MSKKCFVICPLSGEDTEIRTRSNQLLTHIIEPVCAECGFDKPERVDLIANPNSITDKIIECLSTYDLVIADLTGHNPNVFYELGYRTALNKPIIQLKSKTDDIPFDVANINTIDYTLTDLDEVDKVKNRLASMINAFDFENETSSNESPFQQNISTTILQELYQIKDDIATIKNQTKSMDTNAISVLADKLTASSQKSDNQIIIEAILPKLIENPESLIHLFQLTEYLQKNKLNNK